MDDFHFWSCFFGGGLGAGTNRAGGRKAFSLRSDSNRSNPADIRSYPGDHHRYTSTPRGNGPIACTTSEHVVAKRAAPHSACD